ncbi:MAG: endolytic transglycosylase MltG [Spirochaetales bacterium]|nr:endolytic transglycosylase MltG [Spirochaetales bacterium]
MMQKLGKRKIGRTDVLNSFLKNKFNKKKKLYTAVAIVATAVIFLSLIFARFNSLNLDSNFLLDVKKGDSVYSVSKTLSENGVIKSEIFFKFLSKLSAKSKIQRGKYEITPSDSVLSVIDKLANGKVIRYSVVVPEGLIINEVAEIFESAQICQASEFRDAAKNTEILQSYNLDFKSLEGFLYPDTYLIPSNFSAQDCVKYMVKTFFIKNPNLLELPPAQLYDSIILASIVEKEYKRAEEAAKIASVFYNRLEKNMRLQSCATVVYVLKEFYGKKPSRLYYNDLEIDNEFNTYRYRGLPPAPICSPGSVAIKAALDPDTTNYLYFVLKDPATGEHVFSDKFSDHRDAKLQYIK